MQVRTVEYFYTTLRRRGIETYEVAGQPGLGGDQSSGLQRGPFGPNASN